MSARVYTWEGVAKACGVASVATVRGYATIGAPSNRTPFDPLRVWRLCGRIWAWEDRCAMWMRRTFDPACSLPRVEGLLALGEMVGLRDDGALLKLIRRHVDPLPTWYDGRRIVAWEGAVIDWIDAANERAIGLDELAA